MHSMNEHLNVAELTSQEHPQCYQCETKKATCRCFSCKENYCSTCKDRHDCYSVMRQNIWEALSEDSKQNPGSYVLCPQHPAEVVDIYCQDCGQLACELCKAREHKNHTVQSIADALGRVLPKVAKNRSKLRKRIKATEDALNTTTSDGQKVKNAYAKIEQNIETKYQEILKKGKEDCEEVKNHLNDVRTKHLKEIESHKEELELRLHTQRSLSNWADKTLNTARGSSLLLAVKSGLQQTLSANVAEKTTASNYKIEPAAQFEICAEPRGNLICRMLTVPDSKTCQTTQVKHVEVFKDAFSKTKITRLNKSKLDFKCTRFALIDDKFLFIECGTNRLHIKPVDGQEISTVTLTNARTCRSLVKCRAGVVVATSNGLFLTDTNAANALKLSDGDFHDVSVLGSTMYVLDWRARYIQKLLAIGNDRAEYTFKAQIKIPNYNEDLHQLSHRRYINRDIHDVNTLGVTQDYIYVTLCSHHVILQLRHDGRLVATHGSHGPAPGQLLYPHLSGCDEEGTLLVADCLNKRLQTMTSAGAWSILPVPGRDVWPCCAVITHNRFFVVSCKDWGISLFVEFSIKKNH